MRIVFLRKKKTPMSRALSFYKEVVEGANGQIVKFGKSDFYKINKKKAVRLINQTEKRLIKGEKQLRKQAWYKDLKKGNFTGKRLAIVQKWYSTTSSRFSKELVDLSIGNKLGTVLSKSKKWASAKVA